MKTTDDYFADWESHVFGLGYGTGEAHTLGALKTFLEAAPGDGCYDHHALESAVTPPVAWLLITMLVRADIIEYGTSPRFGWLTAKGKALRAYVVGHTVEELEQIVSRDESYVHCYPDHCNCEADGRLITGPDCESLNPFWHQ